MILTLNDKREISQIIASFTDEDYERINSEVDRLCKRCDPISEILRSYIRQHMSMGTMLTHTENGFGSIANILLIIGAGGAFNAILKSSSLADTLAVILSNMHMHPILLAWLGFVE